MGCGVGWGVGWARKHSTFHPHRVRNDIRGEPPVDGAARNHATLHGVHAAADTENGWEPLGGGQGATQGRQGWQVQLTVGGWGRAERFAGATWRIVHGLQGHHQLGGGHHRIHSALGHAAMPTCRLWGGGRSTMHTLGRGAHLGARGTPGPEVPWCARVCVCVWRQQRPAEAHEDVHTPLPWMSMVNLWGRGIGGGGDGSKTKNSHYVAVDAQSHFRSHAHTQRFGAERRRGRHTHADAHTWTHTKRRRRCPVTFQVTCSHTKVWR